MEFLLKTSLSYIPRIIVHTQLHLAYSKSHVISTCYNYTI